MLDVGSSREPGAGEAQAKRRFQKDPAVQQGSRGAGGTGVLRTQGTDREKVEVGNQENL